MAEPYFLYENMLRDADSVTTSGSNPERLYDGRIGLQWSGPSAGYPQDVTITIDAGSGSTFAPDAMAIVDHNIAPGGSAIATCKLQYHDGLVYQDTYNFTTSIQSRETRAWASDDANISSPGARQLWRVKFESASSQPLIGELWLGRKLDFTECLAHGFDMDDIDLVARENRYRGGNPAGMVVDHVRQSVRLGFSQAGVATSFMTTTGVPSWDDFLRNSWSKGRPWVFESNLTNVRDSTYLAFHGKRSSHGAPFISSNRQRLTFGFDVLAEDYT